MDDLRKDISPGSPFVNFFILQSRQGGETRPGMGISHALYDAISLTRMEECIDSLYRNQPMPPVSDFSTFIRISTPSAALTHWCEQLRDAPVPTAVTGNQKTMLKPGKRTRLLRELCFFKSVQRSPGRNSLHSYMGNCLS